MDNTISFQISQLVDLLGHVSEVATSHNRAFTKLAKMNVVGTLRECPERYPKLLGSMKDWENSLQERGCPD